MYFIGISNSSYSRMAAMDADGKFIGKHAGSRVSINLADFESSKESIRKLIREFNQMTNTTMGDCGAVCIGGEDILTVQDSEYMEKILKGAGFTCPVKAVHEAEIYIAAGTQGGEGAVVMANISSKAFGVSKDNILSRTGGWGHLIDEGGSAYRIGMDAIKYALMSYDGRLPKTILTENIKKHFGLKEITDVLNIIYGDEIDKARIAELVVVVKYAARKGDFLAEEIEKKAAKELYRLAEALILRLELQKSKIIMAGTVFNIDDNIKHYFSELIKSEFPHTHVFLLTEKPEIGGIHLAKKCLS